MESITNTVGRQASSRTIVNQIGADVREGISARTLLDRGDGVQFTVGRPIAGYKIVVKLNARDLYDVELGRIVDFQWTVIDQKFDVDAENLGAVVLDVAGTNGAV
jgi:hypothetical protein